MFTYAVLVFYQPAPFTLYIIFIGLPRPEVGPRRVFNATFGGFCRPNTGCVIRTRTEISDKNVLIILVNQDGSKTVGQKSRIFTHDNKLGVGRNSAIGTPCRCMYKHVRIPNREARVLRNDTERVELNSYITL